MARDWKYWLGAGIALILGGLAVIASVSPMTRPIQWLLIAGWAAVVVGAMASLPAVEWLARPVSQWFWRVIGRTRKPSFAYFNLPPDIGCDDSGSALVAAFSTTGQHARKVKVENPSHYGLPEPPPKPSRIVFLHPRDGDILRESDLPATIRSRRADLRITHFVNGGFVMDEGQSVGDVVNIEMYFDWGSSRPVLPTGGEPDNGPYEQWRRSLESNSRIEPTPTGSGAIGGAARAADAWFKRAERLARAQATMPPTPEEIAPYIEVRALRQLHKDGDVLQMTHEDVAQWRQRVERALPEPRVEKFREIEGLGVAVGYVDHVVRQLEAGLLLATRVALLKRLDCVGHGLKLRTPARGNWMNSPVFVETGSWVRNVADVLPLEWQEAWEEKPYKRSTSIEGIAPDFDSAVTWLEETIAILDDQSLMTGV